MESISPKQLRLLPISGGDARRFICERHESHSCPAGIQLAYGVFYDDNILGAVVFSLGNQTLWNIIQDGRPNEVWELARLWLDDRCAKNSESRVLAVACDLVRKRHKYVRAIVTYTTPDAALYKASGFLRVPGERRDKIFVIDGERFYSSRAVTSKFNTMNVEELRARGHVVTTEETLRCRWWKPLREGVRLRIEQTESDKHPDESAIVALWRADEKWLGWPGTFTIREALHDESCVILRDADRIVAAWLFRRLVTRPIFRGVGCVVAPSHRGKGLGRQIARRVQELAAKERRCVAFDCKEANPACVFWEKVGFQRIGTRLRGKSNERYARFFFASKAEQALRSPLQAREDGSTPISTHHTITNEAAICTGNSVQSGAKALEQGDAHPAPDPSSSLVLRDSERSQDAGVSSNDGILAKATGGAGV